MSAFIVSTETMHRVVKAIDDAMNHEGIFGADFERAEPGFLIRTAGDLDALGQALFALNADAVNQRYNEKDEPPTYTYRPLGPVTDPEKYFAIACLIYQCSEGNVPERGLYKALQNLENSIARGIAHNLASARNVPWAWPETASASAEG